MIITLVLLSFPVVWNAETVHAQQSEPSCRTSNNTIGKCISINACEYIKINNYKPSAVRYVISSKCSVDGGKIRGFCCPLSSAANSTKPIIEDCGRRASLDDRIKGGENATLGEYPWMAALGYKISSLSEDIEWRCGGALISDRYVLTAAHCTRRAKPYKVRLGVIDIRDTPDTSEAIPKSEDRLVEKVISHPKFLFRRPKVENDIALLRLEQKVSYNRYIQPICLPLQEQINARLENGIETFVAGWGTTSDSGSSSTILKYVKLPTVSLDVCKKAYDTLGGTVDTRNLCAGDPEGKKDSCLGDSGGPLMWRNEDDGKYYTVGIVSFGRKCGDASYPGVYTKVSKFIDFITANIE